MLQSELFTIVRELRELTGESDRQLYAWAKQHLAGKDVLGVEQTFKTRLRTDWQPSTRGANTCDCRLESRPLNCEIRLRATSLITQFRRDVQRKMNRQLVILWGYEVCTQLLHYRVFRGPEFEGEDSMLICDEISAPTLAAFAKECATLVGLPIKQLLLTQPLLELPGTKENEQVYLGLDDGSLAVIDSKDEPLGNRLPIAPVLTSRKAPDVYEFTSLDGLESIQRWCGQTNAARMAERLDRVVRDHNRAPELQLRVKKARKQLERLFEESYERMMSGRGKAPPSDSTEGAQETSQDEHQAKKRGKLYGVKAIPQTPFIKRYGVLYYLEPKDRLALQKEHGRRSFEDFRFAPGDTQKSDEPSGGSYKETDVNDHDSMPTEQDFAEPNQR